MWTRAGWSGKLHRQGCICPSSVELESGWWRLSAPNWLRPRPIRRAMTPPACWTCLRTRPVPTTGLELSLVATVDAAAEQLRGAVGATHQHAQLAGTLEHGLEWLRAFEHDVSGQLHLGHAVAVARLQRCALGLVEGGHQPPHPVRAAALQDRGAQAIGGGLQRVHVFDGQKGIVGFAETDAVTPELLGDERVAIQIA